MNLENIDLSEQTRKNLLEVGYSKLTKIQESVIPLVLKGKDIIGQSHTGTGKTASFIIPILEKITRSNLPQALIVVPTRELAMQVTNEVKKLSSYNKVRSLAVYGGDSMERQLRFFRQGVDVIVGTPGRLLDHITRKKSFQTSGLKFLVLDEVDEMISKGFLDDIETIMKIIPKSRQTLLFSATINSQVKSFSQLYLKSDYEHIINEEESPQIKNITHYYTEIAPREKEKKFLEFILKKEVNNVIIFANTKRQVEKINELMCKNGIKSDYIHSDLSQRTRSYVLNKFRNQQISLLVATDVAARGIDIKGISFVINYDFPQSTEFYIHRTGRTGRGEEVGSALTFITGWKEKKQLLRIAELKNYKIGKLD